MAAKFFTGLPLDGPDPECVDGAGEVALLAASAAVPRPIADHSKPARAGQPGEPDRVPVTLGRR